MGGQGRIPFTAINTYACRHRIEGDAFDLLEAGIRVLDDVWLEHVAEQLKKQEKPP